MDCDKSYVLRLKVRCYCTLFCLKEQAPTFLINGVVGLAYDAPVAGDWDTGTGFGFGIGVGGELTPQLTVELNWSHGNIEYLDLLKTKTSTFRLTLNYLLY